MEDYMEDFYEKVAEYNALVLDADDLIEQDWNIGIVKVDNSVFDDFVENSIIYIYCPDINANYILEFVMKSEDDDGIIMEWLDNIRI